VKRAKKAGVALSVSPLVFGGALALGQGEASAACAAPPPPLRFTGFDRGYSSPPQGISAPINRDNPLMCAGGDVISGASSSSAWVAVTHGSNIAQIGWVKINPAVNHNDIPYYFWADTAGGSLPVPQFIGNVPNYDKSTYDQNQVFLNPYDGKTDFIQRGNFVAARYEGWTPDSVEVGGEIHFDATQWPGETDPSRHVNTGTVQKMYNNQWYTQSLLACGHSVPIGTGGCNVGSNGLSSDWAIGAGNGWFGIWDTRIP